MTTDPLLFQGRLPTYLPLFDPDHFHEISFFRELERIGYRTVLLGGTGGAKMAGCVDRVRRQTGLKVIMHPASPGEVCPVDLILLPVVMNSNSHYTRPFGSGSVMCALAVAEQQIPYLPVAYFVLGESTARWYSDAFLIRSRKIIVAYCNYARMTGYHWVLLDYEDPNLAIDWGLVQLIKARTGVHLAITDEFTPAAAREGLASGIDTIITPSDIYEEASDPLALAREFHDALLREPPGILLGGG